MKKILFLVLLFVSTISFSQAPQFLNYQAVARDASGTIVTSAIGIQFEILQGSAIGPVIYEETNTILPSSAGVFTAAIGAGSPVIGTFSAINWANGPYFIRVGIDPTGGTSYSTVGTSQLLSVPYALFAEKAGNSQTFTAGNGITINSGTITNASPNQTVTISGPNVLGTYPNYTITPSGPAAGSGISISGGTITNTAPDQTVTINGATGTYPNFTVTPIPATTITSTGSSILLNGTSPSYTVVPNPSLTVAGNVLSIMDGNSVTLPTGTTYTNGAGIALTSGTVITNTAPDQTVTIANGTNVNVTGTYPNFVVNSTPSLALSTNILSISGGNSLTLPSGTTYTNGAGISLLSGTIVTNTATDKIVAIAPGNSNVSVISAYPNFTVTSSPTLNLAANVLSISNGNSVVLPGPPPPTTITGSGVAVVTPTTGTNFNVNVPPTVLNYNSTNGILSYSPAISTNTINITPTVTFTSGILTVGPPSNTVSFVGSGPWFKPTASVVALNALSDLVGIGTNNPSAKIHLGGGTRFGPSDIGSLFLQSGNSIGSARDWKIYVPMPSGNFSIRDMGYDNLNNGPASDAFVIALNSGNVGIGTTTPSAQLDIVSSSFSLLRLETTTANSNVNIDAFPTGAGVLQLRVPTANGISFVTNNIGRMWIDAGGNVGIGTSNPTGKLEVVGNITIPSSDNYRFTSPKTKTLKIGPAEMLSANSPSYQAKIDDGFSSATVNGLNALWATGGTPGNPAFFVAPVHLPDSAVITAFSAQVVKNGGGLQSIVELWRSDGTGYLGNTAQLIASCSTSFSGGSVQYPSAGSINASFRVVDNNTFIYFIRYIGEQNTQNLRFHLANITYQIYKIDQ